MLKRLRLKKLLLYHLYNIGILILADMFDRFFQMLVFILVFNFLHATFKYRFHSDSIIANPVRAVRFCKLLTFIVEVLFMCFCKELDVSIYSNLFVIFLICLLNCLLQLAIVYEVKKKDCLQDKELLLKLCENAKLTNVATNRMVLKYVEHKTYKEIAEIEKVDEKTINQSIRRSRRKLNIW